MIALPLRMSATDYTIFIVLERTNLDRIEQQDPAEIILRNLGMPWTSLRLRDIVVTYVPPEHIQMFSTICQAGDIKKALRFACKGFAYRPISGDADSPYERLLRKADEEPQ